MPANTKCFIIYGKFLDDSMMPRMGGVEKYIADLGGLLTESGCKVTVCQYADKGYTENFRGFTVAGVEGANSAGDILAWIDGQQHDYGRDILIFATDFMIAPSRFKNVIAIQHGVAWDEATYGNGSLLTEYAAAMKNALRSIVKARRYRLCKDLVCVDYNFINWYRTQVKHIPFKIHCIPNYAEIPSEIPRKDDENISVVFARRLVEYRGTRLFADVAADILMKYPEISVTIAGTGSDEEYMRSKLKGFRQVKFTSYRPEDSVKFHSGYNIAVVPTVMHEGTSLSLLEAMSAGCAVIATNIGGMSNIIIDGYNGLMINPLRDELEYALEQLITSRELRHKLAGNAYMTVKEGFSFAKWSEKWLKVIAEIRRQ